MKKELAMKLSQLQTAHTSSELEQYTLPGDSAAEILMVAYYFGDITGNCLADLGCGSGILGIGALLLGATSVIFVDCDCSMIELARKNLKQATKSLKVGKGRFQCSNIENVTLTVDAVVQNPPFGTKRKGADVTFLKKATEIAPVVYTLHKKGNAKYLARTTDHTLTHVKEMEVPLFRRYPFHKKRVVYIEVELLRFEKIEKKLK